MPHDPTAAAQAQAATVILEQVLDDALIAIYLYGSAVAGGLHPASDLDLFALIDRPMTQFERRRLVDRLMPISRREKRPAGWRPLELTVAVDADLTPWRYPPRTDFQYGEWLRDRFDAGDLEPEDPYNPDLALLIEMTRRTGAPLHGPAAAAVLPEVPRAELRTALVGVIPSLLGDLKTDTANVLLTLARILRTVEAGEFVPKQVAAEWVITRLESDEALPLIKARDIYLGVTHDDWTTDLPAAKATADRLEAWIRQQADR